MKIVCISDTHNHHHSLDGTLPNGDLLIHAGDVSTHGSITEIQDFIDWFSQQPHPHKIFVGGNHDRALEQNRSALTIPSNVNYLENEQIIIAGLCIWASPVSPPFRSFGFMWPDHQRQQLYQQIPDNCAILINHSPAQGHHDQVEDGRHVGCQYLAARIAQIQPRLVVCGHIHEGYGQSRHANTHYVNAAIMSRRYQPINPAIVVELD